MKRIIWMLAAVLLLSACGNVTENTPEATTRDVTEQTSVYENITAQEAKEIMDTQEGYIILDTRAQEEFDEGHIPGAIVLPHDEVLEKAESVLPNKDQLILVYCRSGRRSKLAAEDLVTLGYTNIREFGGIIDWPYETVK